MQHTRSQTCRTISRADSAHCPATDSHSGHSTNDPVSLPLLVATGRRAISRTYLKMHSQLLCPSLHRNAWQLVSRSVSKQQYCSNTQPRLVAKAVETQQQPPQSELAPLPWTGDTQQLQVGSIQD
jgi:hypothetical protein